MTTHSKTFNDKGEKFCSRCKVHHPISAFYKSGYVCTATFRTFAGIKDIPNEVKQKHELERDTVDGAIALLRMSHPTLKMANPYKYTRPDAYDLYIQNLKQPTL